MDLVLNLNNVPVVPIGLLGPGNQLHHSLQVNDVRLLHHMYFDIYGFVNPINTLHQHYINFFSWNQYFRFIPNGLGRNVEVRRGESNKFGRAFFRMMLSDYFGIPFFTELDTIINQGVQNYAAGDFEVLRIAPGDTPDFVCSSNNQIFLGEAKGRRDAINFGNQEFQRWRDQFRRVQIRDNNGNNIVVKGYIVATRLLEEGEFPKLNPGIYIEDPQTKGNLEVDDWGLKYDLCNLVKRFHYANVLYKLGFYTLSRMLFENLKNPSLPEVNFISVVDPHGNEFCNNFLSPYYHHFMFGTQFMGISRNILEGLISYIRDEVEDFKIESVISNVNFESLDINYIAKDLTCSLFQFDGVVGGKI